MGVRALNSAVMVAYCAVWVELGVLQILDLNWLDGVGRLEAKNLGVEIQFCFY